MICHDLPALRAGRCPVDMICHDLPALRAGRCPVDMICHDLPALRAGRKQKKPAIAGRLLGYFDFGKLFSMIQAIKMATIKNLIIR
jgi:hypothetical protein